MGERITKVDEFIRWCKNHKWISILVIVGLVIIALGNFTNALETICGLFKSSSQPISISDKNTSSSPLTAINTQTTNASIATEEPSRIANEINAASPMRQGAVAKSFIGAKVRWLLKLYSVKPISDPIRDETLAQFTDNGIPPTIVGIIISDEDKNLLRLSDKGALFYVSGTIEECSPTDVTLSNGKLESYSNDTRMK